MNGKSSVIRRVSVVAVAAALAVAAAACGGGDSGSAKVTDKTGATIARPSIPTTTVSALTRRRAAAVPPRPRPTSWLFIASVSVT